MVQAFLKKWWIESDFKASNSCIRPSVRGVFSRDNLPNIVTRYPCAYVVNTEFSHQHGKHLIAIDLPYPSYWVFFDSLGRKLEEFKDLMNFHVDHYDHFDAQIRSVDTSYCGLIVYAFLCLICFMSLLVDKCKRFFDANVYENDDIVYSFDCHYFDLYRELFQTLFSPMKHFLFF